MRIRTSLPSVLLVATTVLASSACAGPAEEAPDTSGTPPSPSSSPPGTPSGSPTASSDAPESSPAEPVGPTLEVRVSGQDVAPNAAEIELGRGEPLQISFRSDRAGELHVHSKPEQYVEFPAGTSEQKLVIETPGTVEIEEHESGAVVAVVEVR